MRSLAFLLAAIGPGIIFAGEIRHDLYLCVSQSKPFVIGSKVQQLSGLYRIEDRTTPVHVGFNHPRQDALAVDPRDPKRIFTAGLNGVLRSLDGGKTWRIMTSWDMTEPKDIAIDPHAPDMIYAGLPDGIAVSSDAGQTWRRLSAGIKRGYTQRILVDRSRQGRLLAGTELGIYLSDDAAMTWRCVFRTTRTVNDIRQSPHDPRFFVAATQRDGLVLSRDGGLTWRSVAGVAREQTLHNVDFDPHDPRRIIVGGWGCGLLLSEDAGVTWSARNDGLPTAELWRVSCDPDVPGRIYASPHQQPVFASDDFGQTWRPAWFESATVWNFVFVPRR